jgi:hypothetical protein
MARCLFYDVCSAYLSDCGYESGFNSRINSLFITRMYAYDVI